MWIDTSKTAPCLITQDNFRISIQCFIILFILSAIICGCSDDEENDKWQASAKNAQIEITHLQNELKKDPKSPKLLVDLADQYWILGDLNQAESLLSESIKIQPHNPAAESDLLHVLWNKGQYADAVFHAKQFINFKTSHHKFNEYAQRRIEKYESSSAKQKFQAMPITSGSQEFKNTIGMTFVRIPGGTFRMGTDSWISDATLTHRVTLSPYWISKYEVTVGQYETFMKDIGFKPDLAPRAPRAPSDQHPATGVQWYDAEAFSIWLSTRESLIYRLPTEAEWEFAARGIDSRLHPWGNDKPNSKIHGNWNRVMLVLHGSVGALEPVGRYPSGASPFGLLDMSGNAAEWCIDDYAANYYKYSPLLNPYGPLNLSGHLKVQRGSSWRDRTDVNATERFGVWPNLAYDHHGFRLVMIRR